MSISNTFLGARSVSLALCRAKSVFFVGIGGVQMEALALILASRGYTVRGSDRRESAATARLRAAGLYRRLNAWRFQVSPFAYL